MQILFCGPPGSGKGTQCKRLASQLQLPHLSSGDLLREIIKLGTPAGISAKSYIEKGMLVPDDVLIAMFGEILKTPECTRGFILDGFPRNVAQAEALSQLLKAIDRELTIVFNIEVDPLKIKERICGRRICSNKTCNQPYHVKFAPSATDNVCDVCGSPLSQRSDDKEELVDVRLKTYYEQTAPLIQYYNKQCLLKTIDGNGDPDTIFAEILKVLGVERLVTQSERGTK